MPLFMVHRAWFLYNGTAAVTSTFGQLKVGQAISITSPGASTDPQQHGFQQITI
jgi:hypothetical protein